MFAIHTFAAKTLCREWEEGTADGTEQEEVTREGGGKDIVRKMGGFTDREISESPNPTISDPTILNPGIQSTYLIPYFLRIFTIGFLIDSAQRV